MDTETLIRFRDVSASYRNGIEALKNVSFDIKKGETVCIIGANGSGKSTLAKLIDALIVPTSGAVEVFGRSTCSTDSIFSIRSRIGYVFQNPTDQIVNSIVENEVAFGPENLGVESVEIRKRVNEALDQVGMTSHARANVNKLSGGQLQRVALADALAMQPDILIFDESTSMLDPKSSAEFVRTIGQLKDGSRTIIVITHSRTEAELADRIIHLNNGRVVYDGEPLSDVLDSAFPAFPTKVELESAAKIHSRDVIPLRKNNADHQPLIKFEDVSFYYDKPSKKANGASQRPVLDKVDLAIERGETIAVMGDNGSGKSTLIRHMNGLLKPTNGRVIVCGQDTSSKEGANRARKIVGLCMQYPEKQLFAQSVYEDVAYGPLNDGLNVAEVDARVRSALDAVSIDFDTYADMSPFMLSGGEQRRVAIAGVLACDPDVLVLDEPCASLDPQSHIEFLYLIARLKAQGKTIVIVTHYEREAALLADRVIEL